MKIRPLLFGKLKLRDLTWVFVLLIPALYINLGMLSLKGDEAIRALVSMEMMISGDYLTPTLNGELYYNKPPLFNWILIFFFKIFNSNSEFFCRLPTTLFLIVYCLTIFFWVKKQLGIRLGILASIMFLTCARILFWDSFLGLIDITYSWLIFLNFIVIWHFFRKKKFLLLFLLSYVITATCFMLKGLPSLAFQAITLLVLFISSNNFKKLFSWQHALGILALFLIVTPYYYQYYLNHPDHVGTLLLRLISESAQKSAIGSGIGQTILHIFKFPVDLVYHFTPWTVMLILVFNKKILKRAFAVPFIRYCSLVFLANLIIYWLSPITYPRYLLMLVPLLFIVFLFLANYHALANTLNYRVLKIFLQITMFLLVISYTFLPVLFSKKLPVDHVFLKAALLLITGLLALYGLYFSRKRNNLIYTFGIIILISRISFNLFLVPYRESISRLTGCRQDAIKLASETRHEELFLMTDTINPQNAYYLTRERNDIVRFVQKPTVGPYFIVDDTIFNNNFRKEFTMRNTYRKEAFYAGKFIVVP